MQRRGPLQQMKSSWATEQTNGASYLGSSLPQAMGSWPLAQSLFYQYKRTIERPGWMRGKRSAQTATTLNRPSTLINNAAKFSPHKPQPAQSREETWGPHPNTPPAGRCTPRRSRGTLKDGRRRTERCAQRIPPEPCGVCSAFSGKGQQCAGVTAVGSLKSSDVLLSQG